MQVKVSSIARPYHAAFSFPSQSPMYSTALILHLLAATIWTGGHIILSTLILPRALREGDPRILLDFEQGYERIGMPALVVQVLTGLWMASQQLSPEDWLAFGSPQSHLIAAKLLLLGLTVAFALDARLRLIPRLSKDTLWALAWHVWPVSLFSIGFVLVGAGFRLGWA